MNEMEYSPPPEIEPAVEIPADLPPEAEPALELPEELHAEAEPAAELPEELPAEAEPALELSEEFPAEAEPALELPEDLPPEEEPAIGLPEDVPSEPGSSLDVLEQPAREDFPPDTVEASPAEPELSSVSSEDLLEPPLEIPDTIPSETRFVPESTTVDSPEDIIRNEPTGAPSFRTGGEEIEVVGPEQAELYHSPEATREIEPGVGPNPSWDQPPAAITDDTTTQNSQDPPPAAVEAESETGSNAPERVPINSRYSGQVYSLEEAAEKKVDESDFLSFENNKVSLDADQLLKALSAQDIAEKYPDGVQFDQDGYPDFSPYAITTVQVDNLTGNYDEDFAKANEAAGLEEKPEGFTWHHHQDHKTMILVPSDLHSAVRHTGGASALRNKIGN